MRRTRQREAVAEHRFCPALFQYAKSRLATTALLGYLALHYPGDALADTTRGALMVTVVVGMVAWIVHRHHRH
ncbi:hypothetical protein D5S17_18975 [Pseudonocardiaceae bacterium YIM PH 21723]|nr:hypothetical protein D5S17_18975 [Pseudonocardiaceae bacterium YIM PH 21723]